MNKEAKIGLFAVLVLAVLVAVIWAKLAGEDQRDTDTVASETARGTLDQTMIVAGETAVDPAPGSPFEGSASHSKDPSSTVEADPDPISYYNRERNREKTDIFNSVFGEDLDDDQTKPEDRTAKNNTEIDHTALWDTIDAATQKRTETGPTAETPVTTTDFNFHDREQSEWPKEHAVAEGETLTAISTLYYNTSEHWRLIADANRAAVPDPDRLWAGMKLRIPQPPPARGPIAESNTNLIPRPGSMYKVRKGDTLSGISHIAYGTAKEWHRILTDNKDKLSLPGELAEGMVISIPANP